MSTITQNDWLQYLQPTIKGRPTISVSMPAPEPEVLSRPAKDPRLTASHMQIDRVAALTKNWDGHGSARPNEHATERARQLLEDAFRESTATVGWQSPYISASEDGEIVFEWWNGIRKLTIYVGAEQSTFLKSWGPHIVNDMEDGVLTHTWDRSLWVWLFG
jgi:hypothetical protein